MKATLAALAVLAAIATVLALSGLIDIPGADPSEDAPSSGAVQRGERTPARDAGHVPLFGMGAWRSGLIGPRDLDLVRQSGAKLYRFDLVASNEETEQQPGGGPAAPRYDRLVENASRRDIVLLPALLRVRPAGGLPPRQVAEPPQTPAQLARWLARVRFFVGRYGPRGRFWAENPDVPYRPIRAWEVWNEPNLDQFWGGEPDARTYARLLLHTRRALRQVDPQARVLSGGLSWRDDGDDYLEQLLDAAGPCAVDAIAVHPYAQRPERAVGYLEEARSVADAGGARGVELWVTEIGWRVGAQTYTSVPTEAAQATVVERFLEGVTRRREALGLGPSIAFALRERVDRSTGRVDNTAGLRRGKDDTPRPAWGVWSRAARRAGSAPLPKARTCAR